MLRKLLPYLLVVILVLIDISVVPVFTSSAYILPITLVFVMCVGMLLGRMHGVLCGLIGGLLIDISTGYPLGYMMFTYIGCAYFAGLIGCDTDETRAQEGYSRKKAFGRRAAVVFAMLATFEAVTIGYQYFNTALFEVSYAQRAAVRALIGTVLTSALYFPLSLMLTEKAAARVHIGQKREVENL